MPLPPSPRTLSVRIAGSAALGLLTFALHAAALGGWWLWDDPQLVLHAMRTTPGQVLFSPREYLYLAAHTFTPLLTLSFDADLALAGTSAAFFYAHQLAAVAAAAILLFLLLARFTEPLFAWLGAAVFVAGTPVMLAARTLMIRHYVEGLALALAAFLAWTLRKRGGDLAAAALYLLAMLAKEVYAPLPLLMLAQAWAAGDRPGTLARRTIPLALAAAVFVGWRALMLGSWGGFGEAAPLAAMLRLPAEVWGEAIGSLPRVWAGAMLAALLLVVALTRHTPASVAFVLLGLAASALPLFAVAGRFEPRYAFAAFTFVAACLALAAGRPRGPRWLLLLAVATIWCGVVAGSRSRAAAFDRATQAMLAEGRYVWEGRPGGRALLASASPEWYLSGIRDLRARGGRGVAPRFFLSTQPLLLGEWRPEAVYVSRPSGTLARLDAEAIASVRSESARLHPELPIALELRRRDHALHWRFGPAGGSFELVTFPGYARIPLPPSGWQRLPDAPERQFFRVRRNLDDGRWSISPTLPIPFEGETTEWQGTLKQVRPAA